MFAFCDDFTCNSALWFEHFAKIFYNTNNLIIMISELWSAPCNDVIKKLTERHKIACYLIALQSFRFVPHFHYLRINYFLRYEMHAVNFVKLIQHIFFGRFVTLSLCFVFGFLLFCPPDAQVVSLWAFDLFVLSWFLAVIISAAITSEK